MPARASVIRSDTPRGTRCPRCGELFGQVHSVAVGAGLHGRKRLEWICRACDHEWIEDVALNNEERSLFGTGVENVRIQ